MDSESSSPSAGAALGRWWGQSPQPSPSTDVMNQLCRVCGEPAAGFHFGAFTCEGCKSFFGRTYNNIGSITECKNNGECVINKKNRTACKACRLRKCLLVGMSKSGSRYGRRSNWFKIHCLLQEQQQAVEATTHLKDKSALAHWGESYKNLAPTSFDSGSKGSSTEDSVPLNNNNLSKDRERSPGAAPYSAETAAAFWAARHSFFPMQLPHHHLPSLPVPFLHPFPNFPPPGHPQPQRNLLLPFIQNFHVTQGGNHHPHTVSSSPSRSSQGSICSQSPSPRNHHRNTSPNNDPNHRHTPEKTGDTSTSKMAEEHSLALLRSLGPVQEQPMDLSLRADEVKHRRKSKASQRISDDSVGSGHEDHSDVEPAPKEEADAEGTNNNDENFNKRKIPFDLTKSTKLEI